MNRPRARPSTSSILALAACGFCAWDANAQVAAPPPGKALVVLYRVDKQPGAGKVPVIANADRLGEMGNGEFVNATINPGKTFLRAGDRILTTLAIQTAPNQTYYVLVEAVPGLTPLRVEMRQMPEANARRALAQSRPIGTAPAAAAAPRAPLAAAPAVVAPVIRAPAAAAPAPIAPPRPAAPAPQASAPRKPAPPPPARKAPAGEEEDQWQVALIAKAGSFKLANKDQLLAGLSSTYDASAKPVAGAELEFRHDRGFAVGGEVFYYKNDVTATGTTLKADQAVIAGMVNAKYYLEVSKWLYPFVGVGVGYAQANFGGDLSGKSSGAAFQGMVGAEARFGSFGVYVEYKHLTSTTQDSTNQKIKVGGSGVLGGISIAF